MTKISGIGTTETDIANLAYTEGERGDGTSVKIPPSIFNQGCLLALPSSVFSVNASSGYVIPFGSGSEQYDDAGFHSEVTNNTRITIPADGRYQFFAGVECDGVTTTDYLRGTVRKNAAFTMPGRATNFCYSGDGSIGFDYSSPPIEFVAGDYLDFWIDTKTDTIINIYSNSTYFGIQRIR